MLDFIADKKLCAQCGQCVADCPMHIIGMADAGPTVAAENEAMCIRCQHCLAVCPSGAISVAGFDPKESQPMDGEKPNSAQMESLVRGRRSIRQFKPKDVDKALVEKLLNVAVCAPTGKNARQVRFTVINDRKKLAQFREELMVELSRLVNAGKLPPGLELMTSLVHAWEEKRLDIVFRDAPNLVIASAPKTVVSPVPDCIIALTTFELFAQTEGVGTLWCGLVKFLLSDLIPDLGKRLGIPEDHVVGYVMAFGYPAVQYTRMTQHKPADVHWV